MWDNPTLLRNVANSLFLFSLCMVLYALAYYLTHLPSLLPIGSVYLSDAPKRVAPTQVLGVIRREVHGNLFTVDIEALTKSLEKLPWVRSVSIRREFPTSLEVKLEEHQPLAVWNSDALVNQQGEVFVAERNILTGRKLQSGDSSGDQRENLALPEFMGQEGTAAEIAQHYAQFSQQLVSLGLRVTKIILSPRHAWRLQLNNGMVLELGREDVQRRLAVFVEVYPYSLAALEGNAKYIDLRYRNGFAVSGSTKQG